jgi:two-component system cell cycle sensor histidine kinase/response regulator CckA
MSNTTPDMSFPFPAPVERLPRSGNMTLVLGLAAGLVGCALLLSLADKASADLWILFFLGALAAVGVFALFAGALGLFRFSVASARDELSRAVALGTEDGILVVDQNGSVLFANQAYLKLTAVENASDVRTIERVFAADPDVAEAIYRLAQAARDGRRVQEEFRVGNSPHGGPAWFRVRVRPLERVDAQGRETLWTVSDVTRERERQENVFQELQHAIDFLDHAPAGFFSAEPEGTLSYMNATLAGWLDYDLAQNGAGSMKLSDILAGDSAALVTSIPALPGGVRTEVMDVDLKTRTAQAFPVRLLHKVAYSGDGVAGASRTLVLDRSKSENTSDPLRAAEVRFARFFNNTPIAIATVDRNGVLGRTNAAFAGLFGSVMKSTSSRSIFELVAERDGEALRAAFKSVLSGQSDVAPIETVLGASERYARLYISAVNEAEADGETAILYALDTTQQRELEMQFAQSQKMQAVGQLAGGVAHDFNNVLTAIIGYSDLLLANHRPTDPSFQDIMQIKQNANRAAGLVRQLLAFSRRQTLRPQVLALGDVLADVRMLMARLLGEKIKLEVIHGRDLWFVKTDLNQFEQIIVNLAVNARDAMNGEGKLTIRTRNVGTDEVIALNEKMLPVADWVLIEAEDTGSGISAEIMDKIFEPFFSTKEVGKGTGLGLSTVYGIVKQTGGFIFVDSEVGKGTTFRIFLPRHIPDHKAPVVEVEAPAQSADLTGQGTLLLVEDEDAVRSFASRALESRGYHVLTASSGVEALEVVKEHSGKIDLVVSDVVMPEMDGPTLLKELRKQMPDLKIIFVSGYAEDAFKKNLGEEERFSFLPKPFTLKQLIQTVKETIET